MIEKQPIQQRQADVARRNFYATADEAVDGLLAEISDPAFRRDVAASIDYERDAIDEARDHRLRRASIVAAELRAGTKLSSAGIEALGVYSGVRGRHPDAPVAPPLS